jgi:Uri superfamily endonuclease
VRITKVLRSRRNECRLNQGSPGEVLVPGFGASDCKSGCRAHLKYCGRRVPWAGTKPKVVW